MWLTSSSIGRKTVMALTGAFLVLFVTFHAVMNGVALFWPTAYNDVCLFLGANWYALIGSAVLALGFLLHIAYACWLTYENRRARGGDRYAVTSRPKQVEWSSKNMLVLGIVILCFLLVHLYQFWFKMQFAEVAGIHGDFPPAAGTLFIQEAFSCPWTLIIYLIGFCALWLHINHGFWSMFHSLGLDNNIWIERLKCIGKAWSTIVVLLFVAEAVVFTINSKKHVYTDCPALQEQYFSDEMTGDHEFPFAILNAGCTDECSMTCTEAVVEECTEGCTNDCTEECIAACAEGCTEECIAAHEGCSAAAQECTHHHDDCTRHNDGCIFGHNHTNDTNCTTL